MPFAKSPEDGTDTVQCDSAFLGRHARGCATSCWTNLLTTGGGMVSAFRHLHMVSHIEYD